MQAAEAPGPQAPPPAPLRPPSQPQPSERTLSNALRSLKYLVRQGDVAGQVVAAGCVPLLAALLRHSSAALAEAAASAIKELCYNHKEVSRVAGCVCLMRSYGFVWCHMSRNVLP